MKPFSVHREGPREVLEDGFLRVAVSMWYARLPNRQFPTNIKVKFFATNLRKSLQNCQFFLRTVVTIDGIWALFI